MEELPKVGYVFGRELKVLDDSANVGIRLRNDYLSSHGSPRLVHRASGRVILATARKESKERVAENVRNGYAIVVAVESLASHPLNVHCDQQVNRCASFSRCRSQRDTTERAGQ